LFAQTKESPNLRRTLGTKSLGLDDISKTWNGFFALLHDGKSENGEILTDNAASDGLALAFTSSARSVAGVAIGEEESDSSREHLWEDKSQRIFCALALSLDEERSSTYDTLLHRKALLVITASNAEDL
jgi:hypothetical protein